MVANINYAARSDTKRELWSMKIDPKLKWLAKLAAQEKNITLSAFVEDAISILLEAMNDDEPTYGTQFAAKQTKGLYNEGLYDPEESDRFFRLATSRPDLLTDAEKRFWKLFTLGYVGKSFTLGDFREFWKHPSINTSHLSEGAE